MPRASRIDPCLRRLIEILLSAILILLSAPLMLLIWAIVRLDDGPPGIFRQTRAGLHGAPLIIHKFRTLAPDTPTDTVTAEGSPSITRTGVVLRRYRLDELPQLFDVLSGHLALVGPRPELEVDLQHLETAQRDALLAIRPGLTGPVQLRFIDEDAWLAGCADPTRCYRERLLPVKTAANLTAFASRSLRADLACLVRTLIVVLSPAARRASRKDLDRLLPHSS